MNILTHHLQSPALRAWMSCQRSPRGVSVPSLPRTDINIVNSTKHLTPSTLWPDIPPFPSIPIQNTRLRALAFTKDHAFTLVSHPTPVIPWIENFRRSAFWQLVAAKASARQIREASYTVLGTVSYATGLVEHARGPARNKDGTKQQCHSVVSIESKMALMTFKTIKDSNVTIPN